MPMNQGYFALPDPLVPTENFAKDPFNFSDNDDLVLGEHSYTPGLYFDISLFLNTSIVSLDTS